MQDTIERSIEIAAPIDRVWDLVTEPGWWVPSDDPAPADRTVGTTVVRESARWGRFPVQVVDVRPQTHVSFRWSSSHPGDDLLPGRTTLIEFTLVPTDDGVTVTVVESGLAGLDASDAVKADTFESNSDGWTEQLASLRTHAAA